MRVRQLVERCPEIRERVLAGWPSGLVARLAHEAGEARDIRCSSLARSIRRYRRALPAAAVVKAICPQVYQQAVEGLDEDLDVLHAMARLYRLQQDRLDRAIEGEVVRGKLDSGTVEEVRVAMDILASSATIKMHLRRAGGL